MRFSIIVPVYGVESYLRQCLDSILSQTFSDFEAILVDDGSKDKCPVICDEYAVKDSRFKVIHKENGGLVSARQIGVVSASGEYVICVDADDWISVDYLENFTKVIDKYIPDVLVCDSIYAYSDRNVEVRNNLRDGYYSRENLEKDVFPCLIYPSNEGVGFPAQLWAKAFKREIYQHHQQQVNVDITMGEDRACVIPILYHSNSMYVIKKCGYYYRQVLTSMTKAKKPFSTDGPSLIYKHLCKQLDLEKFDLRSQLYRGTCHSLFNVCKSQFYSKCGYWSVVKMIEKILDEPIYKKSIENANFRGSKARKLMHLALKYKLYFLMYIYSKIKQ